VKRIQFQHIARLLVGTIVAVVAAGAVARAQDDEERLEPTRKEELEKFLVEQQRQRLHMAYKAQFDRWYSSQFVPRVGARDQLARRLAARLIELQSDCHLTAAQVKKLQLAGRGDIKRYMDRVNHISRTMEGPRSSIEDLHSARLEMNDLDSRAKDRLFSDDSLLCKTLASTLDHDQAAARENAILERNGLRHRIAVKSAVKALQTNLGMTDEQGTRLTELLLSEARPPRRFGTAPDVALVLFQASRIPVAKIRPIFDDAQWRIASRWMAIYVQGASGEKTLTKNGFVFDDTAAVTPSEHVRPVSKKNETREEDIQPP
jgi:hypothetical protein